MKIIAKKQYRINEKDECLLLILSSRYNLCFPFVNNVHIVHTLSIYHMVPYFYSFLSRFGVEIFGLEHILLNQALIKIFKKPSYFNYAMSNYINYKQI